MKVQVKKEHYEFNKYVNGMRWMSYHYQISETIKIKGNNILLIGIGDNIVVDVLKKCGKNVKTLDFDSNLNPDICGSVLDLNQILNKKFDGIVCCQVLEHIQFEHFENIIKMLCEHTKEKLILSLPSRNLAVTFKTRFPYFGERGFKIPIYRFWEKDFKIEKQGFNEHYWEVNAKKYPNRKIKKILKKYFEIEKTFIPVENTYHIFYILKPKKEI